MKKEFLLISLLLGTIALSGCAQPNLLQTTCLQYCKNQPHIQCVGEWAVSGTYPDCNCSFECQADAECKKEGEAVPVTGEFPKCCEGLELIPAKDMQVVGIAGYCTAGCGNGVCDEIESYHNCPKDCSQETELAAKANEFCDKENVAGVFICGEYIKVASSEPGAGLTFYILDPTGLFGMRIDCPVVAPDSMTEQCRSLILETTCAEKSVC